MTINYYELQEAAQRVEERTYILLMSMTLCAFLFGVLMEWNGLRSLFKRRFKFNWKLFVPTLLLMVLVFIPRLYWTKWFGITDNFLLQVFLLTETQVVLSVLTGTLFIRSISEK
ncbi:hypothetical protein ACFSW4_03210 [Piscibacillus salipiscarius]|uniref:Uncharacterized protein n=2 Tax=Piscibacillus salipiscarius TaxID=299480 RepID=A0ABW5Q7T7_9BACI